ncbi:hypothetical protein ACWGMA_36820 [Streptomyces asiaticus]
MEDDAASADCDARRDMGQAAADGTMICAVMPIVRTVARASRSSDAAPLPEHAEPLRSLLATMTGTRVDVLTEVSP